MRQRQAAIHAKGFKAEIENPLDYDFSKMRVGLKTVDDAIMLFPQTKKSNPRFSNKEYIEQIISRRDLEAMREVSNYYYETNGIYHRMCDYLAYLFKYDWYITVSSTKDLKKVKEEPFMKDYYRALAYFDNSDIKGLFGKNALEVIKSGSQYVYILDFEDKFSLQQLPSNYCRNRFFSGADPVIELNLSFFDKYFTNAQYRLQVLKMFPKEIQKAYVLYKEGKLPAEQGDTAGWVVLDPEMTFKFSLNNNDVPPLINAICSLIDLDEAQELDRKKTMQQLLKIIIQTLPFDKNGELLFDMDEARDIHNNAVAMLKRAVGVDVLTTFCDVDVKDMHDQNSATTKDDLQKVERTVFNNFGIAQNLFNTEGNLALDRSIANDEASMRSLVYQFKKLLNRIIKKFNKSQYSFNAEMLETTIYNYKDLSKMYKEQTQIGFSKLLPQIALGHSQSSILSSIMFENEILHLSEIMIPPMMSSTMSSKNLGKNNQSSNEKTQNTTEQQLGRPEKEDGEKSDKTLANKESMN